MRDVATLFEILFGANIKWTSTRRRAGWILARSKRAGPLRHLERGAPIESHFEQMVQRGHRDQLPSNYGVARRVEPEAKFFNDFSRARACARAQGSVGSDSALSRSLSLRASWWWLGLQTFM